METKGAKNVYQCEQCSRWIVTVNRDEGVTPFMIGCQFDCGGAMQSLMYPTIPESVEPSHEWYRPKHLRHRDEWTRDHIRRGGLVLRRLERVKKADCRRR